MKSARGFTFIELLVVLVIITIIGAIGLAVFNDSVTKSRDSKRKSELRAIVSALEIYYQKQGHYPCAASWLTSNNSNPWITDSCSAGSSLDSTYIDTVPKDPKQDSGNPVSSATNITGYAYRTPFTGVGGDGGSCPTLGQTYLLVAGLENNKDADADSNKNYQYCGSAPDLINREGSNAMVIKPQ